MLLSTWLAIYQEELTLSQHSLPCMEQYPNAKSILLPPLLENERYKIWRARASCVKPQDRAAKLIRQEFLKV